MSLQRNNNHNGETPGGFSNWTNISEAPYESLQERHQVLMRVRIDPESLCILRTARQNQDIADKRITFNHLEYSGYNKDIQKVHHRFLIPNRF